MGKAPDLSDALPAWATEPFDRAEAYLSDSRNLVELCHLGIRQLLGAPDLVAALAEAEEVIKKDPDAARVRRRGIEEARRIEGLAAAEIDRGFPLLHAHAVVDLWLILEVTVRDLVASWIQNVPQVFEAKELKRLTVPLVDFMQLDDAQRAVFLTQELQRATKAAYLSGIDRFEPILNVCGLAGTFESDHRRTMFELSHVRNLIVHRGGVVDERFARACPWLSVSEGDLLHITLNDWSRYWAAASHYMNTIIARIRARLAELFGDGHVVS